MHLYFASAVIKQFHEDGYPDYMRPVVEWSLKTNLFDTQTQLRSVIDNYPVRWLQPLLRILVFPVSFRLRRPDDALASTVARSIVEDTKIRRSLTAGVFVSKNPEDAVRRVINAYRLSNETIMEQKKLFEAIEHSDENDLQDLEMLLDREREQLLAWGVKEKVLETSEAAKLETAMQAIYDALRVDAFDPDSLMGLRIKAKTVTESRLKKKGEMAADSV